MDIESSTPDWSYYNPGTLRTPVSSDLHNEPTTQQIAVSEGVKPFVKQMISQMHPLLKRLEAEALMQTKMSTLTSTTAEASDEHLVFK